MSEQSSENIWAQWLKAWSTAAEQFGKTGMFQHSQDLVKQWQDAMRKMFEELIRNESFLMQMGKSSEFVHLFKAQIEQMIERQLAALHVPTTGSLQEVHVRLRKIDDRLEDLDQRLDDLITRLDPLLAGNAQPRAKAAPAAPVPEPCGGEAIELDDPVAGPQGAAARSKRGKRTE